MAKRSMLVGMDVHKESIDISLTEEGRDGEVRHYGVTGIVSSATRNESDLGIEKLSFSKPTTRPEASFIRTTSSPVSSHTYSRVRSANHTVSVRPASS